MAKRLTETKEGKKGSKFGEVYKQPERTEGPEYIQPADVKNLDRFTIYGGEEHNGRFGNKINFQIAWKENGSVVKKVVTLTANKERKDILYLVRREQGLTDMRLYEIQLGGDATYWKLWDADAAAPENAIMGSGPVAPQMTDDDIPF